MTNEEAIKKLKEFKILHSEQHGFDISTLQALDMAIKALEQESILDKIEEEIEKQEEWLIEAGYNSHNVNIAFNFIKSEIN